MSDGRLMPVPVALTLNMESIATRSSVLVMPMKRRPLWSVSDAYQLYYIYQVLVTTLLQGPEICADKLPYTLGSIIDAKNVAYNCGENEYLKGIQVTDSTASKVVL